MKALRAAIKHLDSLQHLLQALIVLAIDYDLVKGVRLDGTNIERARSNLMALKYRWEVHMIMLYEVGIFVD